jgi:hypothetical protein
MTLALTIGKFGGFYIFNGHTKRICLGWIALTFIPHDLDEILTRALKIDTSKPDPAAKP